MNSKNDMIDSKSLPSKDFPAINVSSADSGIDSDNSRNNSGKLINSLESIRADVALPQPKFLLDEHAKYGDRVDGITKTLQWIKDELAKMKINDKQIAKTIISVRSRIAEHEPLYVRQETGYDSDSGGRKTASDCLVVRRRLNKDCAFPVDGSDFDDNKRATWAI